MLESSPSPPPDSPSKTPDHQGGVTTCARKGCPIIQSAFPTLCEALQPGPRSTVQSRTTPGSITPLAASDGGRGGNRSRAGLQIHSKSSLAPAIHRRVKWIQNSAKFPYLAPSLSTMGRTTSSHQSQSRAIPWHTKKCIGAGDGCMMDGPFQMGPVVAREGVVPSSAPTLPRSRTRTTTSGRSASRSQLSG
jgi:hypothetical protein